MTEQNRRSSQSTILTKVAITVAASSAAFIHAIFPGIKIDLTTAILIVVAAAPWLVSVVKSIELPGGFKIELQDVKAATDSISSPEAHAAAVEGALTDTVPTSPVTSQDRTASLQLMQELATRDPSLALVSMRIEIEKRLRELAEVVGIPTEKKSVAYLLRELQRREAIRPPEAAAGLNELVALGNQAAHGIQVSDNAATWVTDWAPFILALLDAQILRERRTR